jgi:hypothetical protein
VRGLAAVNAAKRAFVATVQAFDRWPVTRVARDKARAVLVQLLYALALYVPPQKGRQLSTKPATPVVIAPAIDRQINRGLSPDVPCPASSGIDRRHAAAARVTTRRDDHR